MFYLNNLDLTEENKAKLRGLGQHSAEDLLSLIEASPEAFANFFGQQNTSELCHQLNSMVGGRPEKEALPYWSLGANLQTQGKKEVSNDQ